MREICDPMPAAAGLEPIQAVPDSAAAGAMVAAGATGVAEDAAKVAAAAEAKVATTVAETNLAPADAQVAAIDRAPGAASLVPAEVQVAAAPDPALWLTPGELAAWLSVARLITRLPWAIEGRLQRDAALSMVEYMTMARLAQARLAPCG